MFKLIFSTVFLTSSIVLAQARPMMAPPQKIPQEVSAKQVQLKAKLQPSARAWIEQMGRSEAAKPQIDENSVRSAVISRFGSCKPGEKPGFNCLAEGDINSLVMLIFAEVAKQSEEDLKKQAEEMKKHNETKKAARDNSSQQNEAGQMRLQMVQERHTKALQALSNMMKRSSETSSNIISNLK